MSEYNPLFVERVKRALKRKRILTDEERQKKARGGFDDSRITKETLKEIEKVHNTCYFCKQQTKAIPDFVSKKGYIQMTCETPGCMGNYYEKEAEKRRSNRKLYGRIIDQKLCFDLGKMLAARDPGRLMVTSQRIVL